MEVLPKEVVQQLKTIGENDALSWQQRLQEIDKVFSLLPSEIIDKLPHPPFFKRLPKETQDKINQIRRNKTMTWGERLGKIHALVSSLPENLRPRFPFPPPPPGGPRGGDLPPGFDEVLPKDVMDKVKAIRENSALSDRQKHERVEDILSSLPADIVEKLPLPPFFQDLPEEIRKKVTKIHRDTSMTWRERHRKIFEIIESLPEDQRPMFPPPPPPPSPRMFKGGKKSERL
ncbi:hypothetical protein COOONC_10200 [Cooperia oncophora]